MLVHAVRNNSNAENLRRGGMSQEITKTDVVLVIALVLAIITLGLQLFAPHSFRALDPRVWSHGVWLGINVAVIVVLAVIRVRQG
jgi:uncharacterized membrane protein